MTWTRVEKLIEAENPVEAILREPSFWESEESIFVQAAVRLREKGLFKGTIRLIQSLKEKEVQISFQTNLLLIHLQAECLLDQRRFAEAIRTYDSILSKVKDPTAYTNRGLCYWELRRYKRALIDYLAALRLAPRDAIAHRSAGELLNKLGKHSQAVIHLQKAIKINPLCSRSYCDLGIAQYNLRNWLKAYRALKRAVQLDPTNKTAQMGLRKMEDF